MLLVYFTLALLAAAADAVGESVCEINPDPKKEVRPSDCCHVGDILPIDFKDKFEVCWKLHPFEYQETFGQDPWTLWVHHTACLDECIWFQLELLDENNHIDTDAVRSVLTEGIEEPVLTAVHIALDNCFAIYAEELKNGEVSDHLTCRSGATELLSCYMREVFLNCPDGLWNVKKSACSPLWDKIESCPRIHVMLHKPSLPQEDPKPKKG